MAKRRAAVVGVVIVPATYLFCAIVFWLIIWVA
jgi:hypothetical protein